MTILLIDSYDSFTFNLSTLVEKVTGAKVVTIHNDSLSAKELVEEILPLFDAIVVGPGPGSPEIPSDVGVLPALWALSEKNLIPVFGVCLGFQSMVLGFGGDISRLNVVRHGQPGEIMHSGTSIFEGLPQKYLSTRYHSLCAARIPPILEELAWCTDGNDKIVMAAKHCQLPLWGVQYHPESICSEQGEKIILNFWNQARQWSQSVGRVKKYDVRRYEDMLRYSIKPNPLFGPKVSSSAVKGVVNGNHPTIGTLMVQWTGYDSSITMITDALDSPFVILGSGAYPGRWSIIGVLEEGVTPVFSHYRTYHGDQVFVRKLGTSQETQYPLDRGTGIWGYLADFMAPKIKAYKNSELPTDCTFIGGLIGYFGYDSAAVGPRQPYPDSPVRRYADVSLVYVDRTILVDHKTNKVYVVSLRPFDTDWIDLMMSTIKKTKKKPVPPIATSLGEQPKVVLPDREKYISKIDKAKEYLASGDSYELCLTAQTTISFPRPIDPYSLYKILLKRNPAPYSCFMNFDSTLVGSSPERFMSWTKDGVCEFRPIKGTVRKGPKVTREIADKILNTPKERGENLMIVDLIRHDLNQLLSNVRVSKLMTVEEYETVFQLVSVIQGDLPGDYKGLDLLAHSLPPGSMTGAPKIRSVEILEELEDHQPRGIYSGVAGYWSVHDEGDWSVIIRSAFSYAGDGLKEWRIGAGGAITILSDSEEEWEEMKTKLESALQAFV